jgi:hemolysin activation/secretion protein
MKYLVSLIILLGLSVPALLFAQDTVAPQPDANATLILNVVQINGFVIVGKIEDIATNGVPGVHGVLVHAPDFLKGREFEKVLAPFLTKPLTIATLGQIQTNIVRYCRFIDHPVVDVFFQNDPETVVVDGVVQIAVVEGKVGKITVVDDNKPRVEVVTTNADTGEAFTNYAGVPYTNGWFSARTIRRNVRLQPGDSILQVKLLDDVNWLNQNPFREVSPAYLQGDVGKTDVELRVKDGKDLLHPFPVRVFAGGDDTGNNLTGNDHLFAGFNWGNTFGLDDQLNYTYTTDTSFNSYSVHSGSYVAPLPWWRNSVTFFGYYADVNADVNKILPGQDFTQSGTAYAASMRYTIPLINIGSYSHELSLGGDYKYQNNNLYFNVTTPVAETPTTVIQAVGSYRGTISDTLGEGALELQGFVSPGDIGEHNDDASYNASYKGAHSDYYYVNFDAVRTIKLPLGANWRQKATDEDFSIYVHGTGQYTDCRLLPSEQLGLGGWATVPGYDERVVSGDKGWVLDTELRLPTVNKYKFRAQLYGFYSYGTVTVNDYNVPQYNDAFESITLASVGPGLRVSWGKNLEARVTYGAPLKEIDDSILKRSGNDAQNGRLHFSVTASF